MLRRRGAGVSACINAASEGVTLDWASAMSLSATKKPYRSKNLKGRKVSPKINETTR